MTKKIAIGCSSVVIVMLVLLAGLFGCAALVTGNEPAEKESTTTTEKESTTTQSPSKSEQDKKDYSVGETIDDDGVKITLNSVSTWPGNEFQEAPQGKEFLVMNWTVVNDSDSDYSPVATSRTVYVDGTATDSAITMYDGETLSYNTLIPGTRTQGDLVYEVPVDWSQILVRVNTILGDECTYTITPQQVQ